MRKSTGKVVNGEIIVEGEPLPEGAIALVIVPDDGEASELTPEMEDELASALSRLGRGEDVDLAELSRRLREISPGATGCA